MVLGRTKSSKKSDMTKISIKLCHASKEAREVYKTLHWNADSDNKSLTNLSKPFDNTAPIGKILSTRCTPSGTSNRKQMNLSMHI